MPKRLLLSIRISDEQKSVIDSGSKLYGSKAAFMDMLIDIGAIVIRHKCNNNDNSVITIEQIKKALLTPK